MTGVVLQKPEEMPVPEHPFPNRFRRSYNRWQKGKIVDSAERAHSRAAGRANASSAVRWNALLGSRSLLNDVIRAQQ